MSDDAELVNQLRCAEMMLCDEAADRILELVGERDKARADLMRAAAAPDQVVDEYDGATSGWGHSEFWGGFTSAAMRIETKILGIIAESAE